MATRSAQPSELEEENRVQGWSTSGPANHPTGPPVVGPQGIRAQGDPDLRGRGGSLPGVPARQRGSAVVPAVELVSVVESVGRALLVGVLMTDQDGR